MIVGGQIHDSYTLMICYIPENLNLMRELLRYCTDVPEHVVMVDAVFGARDLFPQLSQLADY